MSGGSGICPDTAGGDEVSGLPITDGYLPPTLICFGDTVSGEAFAVTQYGLPFYGFLAGLIVAVAGLVPLVIARSRARIGPQS